MSADPIASDQCFVDSNIWLYAVINAPESASKSAIASRLVAERRMVSTQVINEVSANLLRKANRTEEEIRQVVQAFYAQHRVVPIDEAVLIAASGLRELHSLSFWDGLIVAAAIEGGASVLYSEDMHHDLRINSRLRVVNPFIVPVE